MIDPLLPDPAWLAGKGGRPEAHCRRQIVDAIFYLVDNGIKWRALPVDLPPWSTVYKFFAGKTINGRKRHIWADGGYAGKLLDWTRNTLQINVQTVKRNDMTGFVVVPRRWVVERSIAWITRHRRCARDYEALSTHHEAIVRWAMIRITSRRLTRP